ncbi:MAG TPA: BrnT family toxin [Gammaproteobacteria bacterium]|nr:BrnT family toxin [Gammaproteobacteria bacterium]
MEFGWDYKKAITHAKKHLATFDEAMTCFYDPHQVAFYDPDHSEDEDREIMIARSNHNRMLLVCYTIRDEKIRIISARLATKREINDYEAGI